MKKPTVVLCASISFYKDVAALRHTIDALGMNTTIPALATLMEQQNNYDVSFYKDSFYGEDTVQKKSQVILDYFEKIAEGDAVLIVNHTKNGIAGYIGPNVLMEMGVAFANHKPIYILNPYPKDSPFKDELAAMYPIILDGDLQPLVKLLQS